MISEETKAYYDLKKRNDVRESAKRIRRQFLRYKDAEIVYSLQHKKILELASEAGAIYHRRSEFTESSSHTRSPPLTCLALSAIMQIWRASRFPPFTQFITLLFYTVFWTLHII